MATAKKPRAGVFGFMFSINNLLSLFPEALVFLKISPVLLMTYLLTVIIFSFRMNSRTFIHLCLHNIYSSKEG